MKIQQEDNYFTQSLTSSASNGDKLKGVWITQGRLEDLIGQQPAAAALYQINWYLTKPGQGSEVLVYYMEEPCTECLKKIKDEETCRYHNTMDPDPGMMSQSPQEGSQLEVPEGKEIILDGMMAGFNEGMTGEDDVDSDAMEEEEDDVSCGACIGLRLHKAVSAQGNTNLLYKIA